MFSEYFGFYGIQEALYTIGKVLDFYKKYTIFHVLFSGVQIMSIFPIYTLFMELCSIAKKEKSLKQDLNDQQKKSMNGLIHNFGV